MRRLPHPRLPEPPTAWLRRLDLDDPSRLGGDLRFFFHLLTFVALLAIFTGATGAGVAALLAAAALQVARSSLEELAAQRRARRERAERRRQVRLRSHRPLRGPPRSAHGAGEASATGRRSCPA